ncbi:MAG TPA: MAB_1171c family putative transporter [Ktedonobacterales bacterium]|nr:MAB_1171c family putative transporter [Ktedonobacterales bacterium]
MIPAVLSAALIWAATLVALPRYLHARHDVRLAAAWRAIALLAAAMSLLVPAVGRPVDRLLRLPNASHWVANGLVLGTAHAVDEFLYALEHGTAGTRARRLVTLGMLLSAVGLLALLLWRARLTTEVATFTPATLGRVPPSLVGYQLVYALPFCAVAVRLAQSGWRYARTSRDVTVSLGATLSAVGALWAIAWFLLGFVALMLPPTRALFGLPVLCSVMAVLCTTVGVTLPVWSRRVGLHALLQQAATLRSVLRLQSLWRQVTAAVPEAVLPTTLSVREAFGHPEDLDLLLNRRVVEILDARRYLLAGTWPPPVAATSAAARQTVARSRRGVDAGRETNRLIRMGSPREEAVLVAAADAEARALARALVLRTRAASRSSTVVLPTSGDAIEPSGPHLGGAVAYQPPTFEDQVRYLEQIATALRRVGRARRLHAARARFRLHWPRGTRGGV